MSCSTTKDYASQTFVKACCKNQAFYKWANKYVEVPKWMSLFEK